MSDVEKTQADPAAADNLARAVKEATRGGRGPAPVHLWNPPFCGDLDIRIGRDGMWWYLGTPIGRIELVRLFASVLKREDDKYFLVTPVEKIGIKVDDAPFVAVDFEVSDRGPAQTVTFLTNMDERAVAGPDNALRVERDPDTGEPSPYVHIRSGLEALIDRKSYYRLVEICDHEYQDGLRWFGLWSGGLFFPIIPSSELEV